MTKAQTSVLPQPAEQVIASYRALMDDVMSLREFLANVVAKAKMPARPFDWKRAQEAEAAFARGETKPFERSAKR